MTNSEHTTTQPQLIAVSRLEKSPLNVRRTTGKAGIDELKASLMAHGLMQNLVVTDAGDGRFHVIAGGRRLEAIHALQAEGKLPADFAVPCQIVTEERALEMSLAENTVRLAMHPADQFEAFAALIDKGATAAEVAQRFGVEESLVLKRMKLARVAPQLLKEYRNDVLTLECLMAFTITDDHRRQLKVFKSLQHWQKDDPSAIRAVLTEKMVEAGSKLARFVGLDAYVAASGSTRADLFGDEVYLEKPDLLHKLAEQKLDGIRKDLEAEGWGWVEINPERDWETIYRCERIQPRLIGAPAELLERKSQLDAEQEQIEEAPGDTESDALLDEQQAVQEKLDEVEQQLAAFVGFEAEHKRLAGCYVSIAEDGTPFLDKGLVKPEHRKQLARLLKADGCDDAPNKVKLKNPLSESLRRDLAAYRLLIAQVEIARHWAIAIDLLAFQVASELLDKSPASDGPDVDFNRSRTQQGSKTDSTAAALALAAIEDSLPSEWRKPKSEAARFEAFRSLPQEAKLELLAYCVALTLQPKLAPADSAESTAYDCALSLTEGSVASYWRPAKDSYLGRITRDHLLALGRETLGEQWAGSRASDKKAELVDQLDRAFADPAKHGRTPEQVEKLKSWLPAGMAFTAARTPKPAKPAKARKAA
ncbi:MAG TPA: ParB/RepB/Spo0J family partition protein [Gemmataceae bacterium]|nr:ParB/RepB/Spo0J family partition protein [Gemmataceae bacterium]